MKKNIKAYHIESFGNIDGIINRQQEKPTSTGKQVFIKVKAASISRRDLYIIEQIYPLKAVPGIIPVSDGAGEIVEVGDEVTRFKTDDKVTANKTMKDGLERLKRLGLGQIDD